MTDQTESELLNTVLQLLTSQDSGAFGEGLRSLVNEAMILERAGVLQVGPETSCSDGSRHRAFFSLPTAHPWRVRTSDAIERGNQALKRRTHGAALFPNEAFLRPPISALLRGISEECLTGKIYRNMNPTDPLQC